MEVLTDVAMPVTYTTTKILHQETNDELQNVAFALVEFRAHKPGNKHEWYTKRIKNTVIKYYKNTKTGMEELLNEVAVLHYINTEIKSEYLKVPKTFYYKTHKKRKHEHFISCCPGQDLERWFNPDRNTDQELTLDIIIKIAKAIQVLHNNNIAHRDIKPENIMLHIVDVDVDVEVVIYLIDFAYSTIIKNGKVTEKKMYCGTPLYVSPELAYGFEYNLLANDIWAFGAMIYCLCTDKYLKQYDVTYLSDYMDLCRHQVNEYCHHVDPRVRIMLRKIFTEEKDRVSINEIVELLQC